MRVILGIVLLVHAVAHLPGFLSDWRLATLKELPYKTTLVGGFDVGPTGIRFIGALWLLAALAFGMTALGVFVQARWWPAWLLGVSLASLVLCILGWPEARLGIAVNVALLGALALVWQTHWSGLPA
jgi:hypothetical protein